MTPQELEASLSGEEPPTGLHSALRALWHLAKGGWERAHELVQADESDPANNWVHAHLHRVEGDLGNAGYWYRRAGRPVPSEPLESERRAIIAALLARAA